MTFNANSFLLIGKCWKVHSCKSIPWQKYTVLNIKYEKPFGSCLLLVYSQKHLTISVQSKLFKLPITWFKPGSLRCWNQTVCQLFHSHCPTFYFHLLGQFFLIINQHSQSSTPQPRVASGSPFQRVRRTTQPLFRGAHSTSTSPTCKFTSQVLINNCKFVFGNAFDNEPPLLNLVRCKHVEGKQKCSMRDWVEPVRIKFWNGIKQTEFLSR